MRTLFGLIAVVALLVGCNTFEGMGKDIKAAGEKLEATSKKR